jgi:hypothetical protein
MQRLAHLSAGGARISEVLERGGNREMIGGEGLLPDFDDACPQLLRRLVTAEGLVDERQTGEHSCDLRPILSLGSLDREQAEQRRLSESVKGLLEAEPDEVVEEYDELGLVFADTAFAYREGAGERRVGFGAGAASRPGCAETGKRGEKGRVIRPEGAFSDDERLSEKCFGLGVVPPFLFAYRELDERGAQLNVSRAITSELLDRGLERQVTRNGVSGKAGEPTFQLRLGSCFGHRLASSLR